MPPNPCPLYQTWSFTLANMSIITKALQKAQKRRFAGPDNTDIPPTYTSFVSALDGPTDKGKDQYSHKHRRLAKISFVTSIVALVVVLGFAAFFIIRSIDVPGTGLSSFVTPETMLLNAPVAPLPKAETIEIPETPVLQKVSANSQPKTAPVETFPLKSTEEPAGTVDEKTTESGGAAYFYVPFKPTSSAKPFTDTSSQTQLPDLSGIMYSKSNPKAILNGVVFSEGETVDGYTLSRILPDSVLLKFKGKNEELELKFR